MRRSGSDLVLPRGASDVPTTFIDQKPNKTVHRGVVGPADESRRLTLLSHQPRQDQPMQVVRERRGGDLEFVLQATNRQSIVAGPNQRFIELEARRAAERLELLCCFFDC